MIFCADRAIHPSIRALGARGLCRGAQAALCALALCAAMAAGIGMSFAPWFTEAAFADPGADSAVVASDGSQGAASADENASADATGPAERYAGTTYRLTVYAGNQGLLDFKGNGTDPSAIESGKIVYEPVAPGAWVDLTGITVTDASEGKYYVKGLRAAALDNVASANISGKPVTATLYYAQPVNGENPLTGGLTVTEDTDLVVAYGIMANRVQYTVNYQDANGNAVAESQTFFGDVGDTPAVAAVYVDGYVPDVSIRIPVLKADGADNVITFTYSRLASGFTTQPEGNTVTIAAPDGSTAPGAYVTQVTEREAETVSDALAGAETEVSPLVTDEGTVVLDEDGNPLAVGDVETIADEDTALAAGEAEGAHAGVADYLPWIIGIIAALFAIVLILVRQRKKNGAAAAE